MMQSWVRSGTSGPAHWVKLSGGSTYTVACQVVIMKEHARRVETIRKGLANQPGVAYHEPVDGEICQTCREKAIAQA
jgi:hypothetical protein